MDSQEVQDKAREVKKAVSRKAEEAEGFVTDSITKIRSKMAPSGKTYPAPVIPDTPSQSINKMLQNKCNKTFENPVKYGIAFFICFIFTAIVRLYGIIHKDAKPSHSKWMAACGVVSLGAIVGTVVFYYLVFACSFLLHSILYYGCILIALTGVGIGVSGAVFFDKDGSRQSPGFEPARNAPSKSE